MPTGQTDHPLARTTLVGGNPEDWNREYLENRVRWGKMSDWGALHVDNQYGRLLFQLKPPAEPGVTTWTPDATSGLDPRWIICDTQGGLARVKIKINVTGADEDEIEPEIFLPNGHWRPIRGVSQIKLLAGIVSIYGEYEAPPGNDEDDSEESSE